MFCISGNAGMFVVSVFMTCAVGNLCSDGLVVWSFKCSFEWGFVVRV